MDSREDKFAPAIVPTLLHQKTIQVAAGNGFSPALTGTLCVLSHPMSTSS